MNAKWAFHVKQAIDAFKAARESQYPDCLVNLGVLSAGSHPAVVPGSATMSLNLVYAVEEAGSNQETRRG